MEFYTKRLWFALMVGPGGPWDFKTKDAWRSPYDMLIRFLVQENLNGEKGQLSSCTTMGCLSALLI